MRAGGCSTIINRLELGEVAVTGRTACSCTMNSGGQAPLLRDCRRSTGIPEELIQRCYISV
jgi:hypothetical protein